MKVSSKKITNHTNKLNQKKKTEQALDLTPSTKPSSFEDMLEQVIPISNEKTKDIHLLWRELPSIEKQFISEPNNENLKLYKEYITSIMELTLKQNTVIKNISFRRRDDDQTFQIIKVINQELHMLNHIIIKKENAAFNLMKKIENIKGLLLDIKK